MFFNSIDFTIFLPVVFILYWVCKNNLKLQNIVIVAASYFFYGWWDWRFLALILFSSIVDYSIGLALSKHENEKKRKMLLRTSIFINIGFLGYFKYCNFFLDSFIESFSFFGYNLAIDRLNIVLPVGISFYTFQTLSYTIDVYKKRLKAENNIVAFIAFVSFFPQLVAGPIERASSLLPQFCKKRTFDYSKAIEGSKQMFWGFFKKIVIADSCGFYVDQIFNNYSTLSAFTLTIGVICFSIQIYADFSGYSDIAIGTSRLFGFNLMTNFRYPNFSRDIGEYWRRWHISLSTWFRDYIYIPIGGSRSGNKWCILRNIMIIFTVSGFWHGANWTFIIWGALNGLLFLPSIIFNKHRKYMDIVAADSLLPSVKEFFQVTFTFLSITFTRIFFRSEDISSAFEYATRIFLFRGGDGVSIDIYQWIILLLFMTIEWFGRRYDIPLLAIKKRVIKYPVYLLLAILIVAYFNSNDSSFIYFQF